MRAWILLRAVLGSVWIATAPAAAAATFFDGFDGNAIDPAWWTVSASGGSSVVAASQRIELTQGAGGAAGLTFTVTITGDFDARIDYVLLDWPSDNKERLALGAAASPSQQLLVERVSDSSVGVGAELYVSDFTGQGILGTPTSDVSGTLRLLRSGDQVTGSFWNGSAFQVIGTYAVSGEGALGRAIGFAIFPGAPVTPGVRVALDNFRLEGPNVPAPEPGSFALVATGALFLAAGSRRSRRRQGGTESSGLARQGCASGAHAVAAPVRVAVRSDRDEAGVEDALRLGASRPQVARSFALRSGTASPRGCHARAGADEPRGESPCSHPLSA